MYSNTHLSTSCVIVSYLRMLQVNKRAPVDCGSAMALLALSSQDGAILPRQKEATIWPFPSEATTPTNNEDRILLQEAGFSGVKEALLAFAHAKCNTLLHVSHATAPQITITRAAFPRPPFARVS